MVVRTHDTGDEPGGTAITTGNAAILGQDGPVRYGVRVATTVDFDDIRVDEGSSHEILTGWQPPDHREEPREQHSVEETLSAIDDALDGARFTGDGENPDAMRWSPPEEGVPADEAWGGVRWYNLPGPAPLSDEEWEAQQEARRQREVDSILREHEGDPSDPEAVIVPRGIVIDGVPSWHEFTRRMLLHGQTHLRVERGIRGNARRLYWWDEAEETEAIRTSVRNDEPVSLPGHWTDLGFIDMAQDTSEVLTALRGMRVAGWSAHMSEATHDMAPVFDFRNVAAMSRRISDGLLPLADAARAAVGRWGAIRDAVCAPSTVAPESTEGSPRDRALRLRQQRNTGPQQAAFRHRGR